MSWTQTARVGEACFRWLRAAACVLVLAHATTARAQSPDNKQRAAQLFNQGVEHFDAERYEQALKAFEQAYRLAPHHMVRVNMAGCFAKLGRPVEALFNYERFLQESEGKVPPAQEREVRQAIAELEKQVGAVELSVQPSHADVRIDGRPPRALPDGRIVLKAGDYPVQVSAHGYELHEGTLTVRGGETSRLNVSLKRTPPPSVATTPVDDGDDGWGAETGSSTSQAPPVRADGDTDGRAWWMQSATHWGFFGAGLAVGVGAAVAGGITLKANNDFDDAVARANDPSLSQLERVQARNDGLAYADRSDAAGLATDVLAASAVGLGAGAFIMWMVTRSRDKKAGDDRSSLGAAPLLGAERAGLGLWGRY